MRHAGGRARAPPRPPARPHAYPPGPPPSLSITRAQAPSVTVRTAGQDDNQALLLLQSLAAARGEMANATGGALVYVLRYAKGGKARQLEASVIGLTKAEVLARNE